MQGDTVTAAHVIYTVLGAADRVPRFGPVIPEQRLSLLHRVWVPSRALCHGG